jgi:uncharacterized protein
MAFDQCQESSNDLQEKTRARARRLVSLTVKVGAIDWYEQRLSVEKDNEAGAIPLGDAKIVELGESARAGAELK